MDYCDPMDGIGAHTFEMWVTFGVIGGAFTLYAWERISIEVVSLGVLCVLMVFFTFFPVGGQGVNATNAMSPEIVLAGFANPGTMTVALMFVVAAGVHNSGGIDLLVEKVLPPEPGQQYAVCVKGRRACPPEDVGGVWGYEEFLEAIGDPDHPEHEMYMEWIGGEFDPEEFDLEEANELLRGPRKSVSH